VYYYWYVTFACGAVEEAWLLFSSSVDSWQWVLLKAADNTEVPADLGGA
jgi:hypothetical protein